VELEEKIKAAIDGLVYVSETDSGLRYGKQKAVYVDFNEFFKRQTRTEKWMDAESRRQAEKWYELRKLLEANLYGLRIIKKGTVNQTIEISGVGRQGYLHTITAKGVET
jgi:hypothetical protein